MASPTFINVQKQVAQDLENLKARIESGQGTDQDTQEFQRLSSRLQSNLVRIRDENPDTFPQFQGFIDRLGIQFAEEGQEGGGLPAIPLPTGPDLTQRLPVPDVIDPETGATIPGEDIPLEGPRGDIEREGLRQFEQGRRSLGEQLAILEQRRGEFRNLLESEQERQFGLNQPFIQEQLQEQGLLRSSGLGEALARERARLAGASEAALREQALRDAEFEVAGVGNLLAGRQSFQRGGLEREISLEDFDREARLARELGAAVTPNVRTPSAGQRFLGGAIPGGILGGALAAPTGGLSIPLGAALGAIGGGGAGIFGSGGGGK